ncbi:hypothetical protein C1H46_013275 [Malus baccata]|uniref:Uncharacterized protein n=1 Tax=Malus baccata TaxID=106549 RepID=A0A540MQQ2_MALBA|nr:hypothetical protein C1H46_013275 [Malus baccata]
MRIHRIGQEQSVVVRRFIVKDTVEERMRQLQARKQRMIAGALTNDEEFDLPELRSSKCFSPRSLY